MLNLTMPTADYISTPITTDRCFQNLKVLNSNDNKELFYWVTCMPPQLLGKQMLLLEAKEALVSTNIYCLFEGKRMPLIEHTSLILAKRYVCYSL